VVKEAGLGVRINDREQLRPEETSPDQRRGRRKMGSRA
jgi:hypothetical protein